MPAAPDHPVEYQRFLARVTGALAASGGQLLLSDHTVNAAPWTAGWDRIVLVDTPGSPVLYAIGPAAAGQVDANRIIQSLHPALDRLSAGIAGSGFLGGPTALQVVAVFVFLDGSTPREMRAITRLAPTTFYPGMRPSTWSVDLAAEAVYSGRWSRNPAAEFFRRAAKSSGVVELLDADGVNTAQRLNTDRTAAFYALMRGRQPTITYGLIALNVAIYLLLNLNGGPQNESTLRDFGALSPRLVEQGQWWRLFSSMFLHAGVAHILFNMTSLFAIGTLAERLYGSWKYLAIYLGSGLIGSLASFGYAVATGNLDVLGVGASGAIFGVAGCLLTVRFQSSEVIPKQLRDRVSSSLLPLVLISLFFAFLTPYVDNGAHLGGLAGGVVLSFVFPLVKELPSRQ